MENEAVACAVIGGAPFIFFGMILVVDMIEKIGRDGFGSDCYGTRPDPGEIVLVCILWAIPILIYFTMKV